MRTFQVLVKLTDREFTRSESCRDQFLDALVRFDTTEENLISFSLQNTKRDLPDEMLDEICGPRKLTWSREQYTTPFSSRYWRYTLSGKNYLFDGIYWTILGERLLKYYNGDMLEMMRVSPHQAWDYGSDRTDSIAVWKYYSGGKFFETRALLDWRRCPINYAYANRILSYP